MNPVRFFILGRPRSGTTLLKALFDAHPNVRIPSELPVMLILYQRFKHVRYWDEVQIRSFVDHLFSPNVFNNRRIENLRIDRQAFADDLLKLTGERGVQDFLMKINEHGFSLFPKGEVLAVGDKNPVYSVYARRLMSLFPEAKFICIVRDYRDNFVSLRNVKGVAMEAPVLSLQVARWRILTRLFVKLSRSHPDRVRLIRYEDLVNHPEETVRSLCNFLALPYDPSVFRYHEKSEELKRSFPNPLISAIHKSLMHPVNTTRIGLWKSEMTPAEVALADQLAGSVADRLGYARSGHFGPMRWIRSRPMTLYAHLLFHVMRLGARLPYPVSRWLALNVTRLARMYKAAPAVPPQP